MKSNYIAAHAPISLKQSGRIRHSPTPDHKMSLHRFWHVNRPFKVLVLLGMIFALPIPVHANPGWAGGRCSGWNGGGYYYRGGCNPGGWYGTGIPNGLGWTLFGLAAASGLSAGAACAAPAYGSYYAPVPVYPASAPVIVQQPVIVPSAPVQAPLVNYNGTLCYYIGGNYYPASPIR